MIKRICSQGDCLDPVKAHGLCAPHLAQARAAGKFQKHTGAKRLMARYRITPEDYAKLFRAQRGVCAICGRPARSGKNLVMDHDYKTRLVRGLLHRRCNALLTRAVEEYLANPPGAAFGFYVPEEVEERFAEREARRKAKLAERRALLEAEDEAS